MDLVYESANDICERMFNQSHETGTVIDVKKEMYLLIYNVISSIVFGKRYSEDDQDFINLRKNTDQINKLIGEGFLVGIIPFLKYIPTPGKSELKRIMGNMFEYFDKNIEEHKRSLDEGNPRDITDHVLITKAEMEREGKEDMSMFTYLHVRQTLTDIFFAGADSTASIMLWALLFCIEYPEKQEKAFEEIDRVVGTRMVGLGDKRNLPYTDAFLLEVIRSRSVSAMSVPHSPSIPLSKLYGYNIDKGANIVANIWGCHHDARYWEDPEAFIPERFIDPETKNVNSKPEGFLPFSLGKRACAGEHLARADTFLVFATLMQKLKFVKVGNADKETALTPNTKMGPILCVPNEYKIKVERR